MGGLYAIDPYDQPAVQLGKDATYALMGKPGYADLEKRETTGGEAGSTVLDMIGPWSFVIGQL
jgi:hypothetical protein